MATKANAASEPQRSGLGMAAVILSMATFSLITLGGTYAIIRYIGPAPKAVPPAAHASPEAKPAEHRQNPTYPLDQFIINLGNPNDRRFLKTSVTLEIEVPDLNLAKLKGEALHKALEEFQKEQKLHEAAFKDTVIEVLSRKRVPEVATPQGKEALKVELQQRLNALTGEEEKVVKIFFTDFIVQ